MTEEQAKKKEKEILDREWEYIGGCQYAPNLTDEEFEFMSNRGFYACDCCFGLKKDGEYLCKCEEGGQD